MMASDIEIVNLSNFEKIQNFLNDSAYKEILENSENFNTRLCIERRLRMPFLDPQTGVAQTHCALFMKQKQRMPGFRDGQIYTYPSARWRKPKRQYLLNHHHSYRAYQYREPHHQSTGSARDQYQAESAAIAAADGNSMSASGDNDSKDSHSNAEKGWFHEDMDMSHYHHVEDFEEDFDSDNDFDESYSSRGKRKRGSRSSRKSNIAIEGTTPKRGRKGGGSSRRRTLGPDGEVIDRRRRGASSIAPPIAAINDETSQPLPMPPSTVTSCSTSTTTITLDKTQNDAGVLKIDAASSSAIPSTSTAPPSSAASSSSVVATVAASSVSAVAVTAVASAVTSPASPKKEAKSKLRADRVIAESQHYCDFCLGDQFLNKKTNLPEELVSCSDCGRAGHPFCLQFTPNMIISVKRYRWQCIECKYCSICGTSDNDDQLLFCDDCDRGYHMYCLSPPLIAPPEGSWSCKLCMEEFHKDDK